MTAEEIESLVKNRWEMPEDLNIAEMCYFISLENIRDINGRAEKVCRYRLLKGAFEDCKREIQIYSDTCAMRVKLAGISKEMIVNGCPICRKAIAVFDGRETPWNESKKGKVEAS